MYCPHCGEEVTPVEGQKYCSFCGGRLEASGKDGELKGSEEPRERGVDRDLWHDASRFRRQEYCPWEDQENLGFFPAIARTVRETLFSPEEFFSRLPLRAGFVQPLLFALIISTLSQMVGFIWALTFDRPMWESLGVSGDLMMLAGIMIPVVVFIRIVVLAGLFHVSLYLVGGATEDFEATFRVTCYSAAPDLCRFIPIVGQIIAIIWQVYLALVGLAAVHRINKGRAAIAVLLPLLVCCSVSLAGIWMVLETLKQAVG